MKKIITTALALAMCMQFAACSQGNSSGNTESTTSATTAQTTAAELVEPEEHGTSAYLDYLCAKAKADAQTATTEELQNALDWLKDNTSTYFDSQENMEQMIYNGELLEYKYKKTGSLHEKIGWQAFKTVKYVYRGAESVSDSATQDNLAELKELLANVPDIE